MYLIQTGIVEIFTYFEKVEFILEKLYNGSLLNYRIFL